MGNALQQIDMGLIGVTDKIIGMISFTKSLWKRLLDIYLTPVIRQARRLVNVFIFIDDIVAISGGGEFEWDFKEIYLPEVIIEKENLIMKNMFWIYL